MNLSNFEELVSCQIEHCLSVLRSKGDEYVFDEDRLEHFKTSAATQDCTPKQALWGMASKHIVSLAGMCKSNGDYSTELWREKITDTINYLFLLWALVKEGEAEK